MTFLKLTLRSAIFYRQAHALVLAGTMLATAILVGAMLIGDSVKFSLTQSALLRLGHIEWAMDSRGRFFPADLADRLANETGAGIVPVLLFRGIVLDSGGTGSEPRQINNVQILGVPDSFWAFAPCPKPTLTTDGIAINEKLARELQIHCGEQISIRFSKPSLMPRDAPLSSQEKNDTLRATFTVEAIVNDHQLGRFNLAANQQVPYNVFVSLPWLQETAGLPHQANLLLANSNANQTVEHLNQAIRKVWRLEDAGLMLKPFDGGRLYQLESKRVFMDPNIGVALSAISNSAGALTYLVNSIATTTGRPNRETPYSFVVALSPSSDSGLGLVPPEMTDDEIIVNRWLADQLAVIPGDSVKISYYEFGSLNQVHETNHLFKVRSIVEMQDMAKERELGPNFPGLTDAGKCTEWDIGIPLQKNKIEDPANETYWNDFRATPQAVITLKAGQKMWANRFGNLTAIRLSANTNTADEILQRLNPSESGLAFLPIRQTALKAVEESMDFGQLFLGMSFFLIFASLTLTSLLFVFGIQQRSDETGLFLALGFRPGQIRRLWIQECILIAALGAMAGAWLGSYYTRGLIWCLSHIWQGAVANAEIQYQASLTTIGLGTLSSFTIALGSLFLMIRRESKKSAQALFSGETPFRPELTGSNWISTRRGTKCVSIAGMAVALGLIGYASVAPPLSLAPIFFTAGCLLLISLLGFSLLLLIRLAQTGGQLTILKLGFRNAGRRSARSLTAIGLLACGCFIIIAVSAMQEDIESTAHRRDSGTGGFTLFGDSTLPIQADLNSQEGRKKFKLDQDPDLISARIVSMKVKDGDDASCLNLNRAQTPTLIGVDPHDFEKRGAFQPPDMEGHLWSLLTDSSPDGIIPGLAGDANTAEWGLKKKPGDILIFNNERGETFQVKLVGYLPMRLSVFQGNILIPVHAFSAQYPSENGSRRFLIDTLSGTENRVKDALTLKLGKWGINMTSTTGRLKSFYSVESTYMAIFMVLGGLGLLLGSAGMSIVVLRNIRESRKELALLAATGYSHRQILMVVWAEHGIILGLGLATGIMASLAAIWPGLRAPGIHLPWLPLSLLICGMMLFQVLWVLLATWIALRAPLLNNLRNQ